MSDHAAGPPDHSQEKDRRPTRFGALMKRRPIAAALGFECALAILALLLALLFGLQPWLSIDFSATALGLSVLATVPMVAAILALMQLGRDWVEKLRRIVEDHLLPLFSNAGPAAVFAVALAAGVCEELLFRGVIQAGLEGLIGPAAALAAASLLFGLAHALTLAYFVLTCLMGLYLGWLYQASGNLLVPIMVHFLYDWVVLAWYLRGVRQTR